MINNKFYENYEKQNYYNCIEILADELKIYLTNKIKEVDNEFKYVNMKNLLEVTRMRLSPKELEIAEDLHDFYYNEEENNSGFEQLMLKNLLNDYNENVEKKQTI